MKVAIVGSRDFRDLGRVAEFVRELPGDAVIISGGARGVDRQAEATAIFTGRSVVIYPADWDRHGRRAGFIRNELIVMACDELVAFWDGRSRGTQHSIDLARKAGKKVTVFTPGGIKLSSPESAVH